MTRRIRTTRRARKARELALILRALIRQMGRASRGNACPVTHCYRPEDHTGAHHDKSGGFA